MSKQPKFDTTDLINTGTILICSAMLLVPAWCGGICVIMGW